ncbi:SDR family oxidoreductase [bacterium]|nr:SDR family oxidoreductase [bacterium]
MDLQLKRKVALVQGATKGLGLGVAEALAAEGCDLLLTARTASALSDTAARLAEQYGIQTAWLAADSADLEAIPSLVKAAEDGFGRLDILVCNSGGPAPGGIRQLTAKQWADAAQLVLASPALLLKEALPLLERSASPRFFVITSSSTRQPVAGLTLSNSMRPGVVGLIKSIVEELGPTGLCCHSIAPGRFDTDRLKAVIRTQAERAGKSDDAIREAMLGSIPAGRLGEPIELGRLVAYLSSPLASYLNGGNWVIDGGLVRAI